MITWREVVGNIFVNFTDNVTCVLSVTCNDEGEIANIVHFTGNPDSIQRAQKLLNSLEDGGVGFSEWLWKWICREAEAKYDVADRIVILEEYDSYNYPGTFFDAINKFLQAEQDEDYSVDTLMP